ncbi:glycosyltransferase family 2 protein [Rivibacter subsaxonicus]|uniref:Glycosyltransferase involved in cell wall biosynthesis n=1 Tax=Rivibacter subsaxonicus TaxID=457575 RepID=A0A4Q7W0V2_9BURK|nr:glycosyltransferase family 2 protein [Rivibacter subsaxonicus]RZU02139.1 glycosyltransferase involved in cell wall biosynthesis [Rivibacter subsaxonicus]
MDDGQRLPRVVACLPAWKAETFIEPTLASLAAQSYPNLQILIADDASPDGTWALCQRFAQGRANVELHRQPRNLGWIGNVNWLLRHADGDYLFFAFHDDPLEPGYVTALVEALERNPQAVLAFSDAVVDLRGEGEAWVRTMSFSALDGLASARARLAVMTLRPSQWWLPNRGLLRSSAVRRVGGMRRHLAGEFCADWPWLLHLSLLGEFVRVPQPLVHKVWRREGLSKSWRWTTHKRAAVTLACLTEILRADLPLRQRLRLAADFGGYWGRRALQGIGRRLGRT